MHWQDTETRQLGHTLSPGSHPLRACCIPHCNVSHLDLAVQRTDMCAARTLLQRSRGPRGCMLHASRSMQHLSLPQMQIEVTCKDRYLQQAQIGACRYQANSAFTQRHVSSKLPL